MVKTISGDNDISGSDITPPLTITVDNSQITTDDLTVNNSLDIVNDLRFSISGGDVIMQHRDAVNELRITSEDNTEFITVSNSSIDLGDFSSNVFIVDDLRINQSGGDTIIQHLDSGNILSIRSQNGTNQLNIDNNEIQIDSTVVAIDGSTSFEFGNNTTLQIGSLTTVDINNVSANSLLYSDSNGHLAGAASYLPNQSWNPNFGSSILINITGVPTQTNVNYSRLANMVFFQYYVTGISVTSANTRSVAVFDLPINTSNNGDNIGGSARVLVGTEEISGQIAIRSTSVNNQASVVFMSGSSTGATTMYVNGWYQLY